MKIRENELFGDHTHHGWTAERSSLDRDQFNDVVSVISGGISESRRNDARHWLNEILADVVADLLTIARGVASKRKPCRLNTLIDQYFQSPEYIKLQSEMENIVLVRNYSDNLLNISGSEVHIKKCIMKI